MLRLHTNRRHTSRFCRPLLERFEDRSLLAYSPDFFHNLADALDQRLDATSGLQHQLDTVVYATGKIPLVGDQIAQAGPIIESFRDPLHDALFALSPDSTDDAIRTALFNLLNPDPAANPNPDLRLLGENDGTPGITPGDILLTHPVVTAGSTLQIDLHLSRALAEVNLPLDFSVGLDSLPIYVESTGDVVAKVGFDYQHFTFGYSDSSGFSFDTALSDELTINFTASLADNAEVSATVGFLHGKIIDGDSSDPAAHSTLTADFLVDVQEAGVAFDLDASADLFLQIDAGISAGFPSIGADFEMHWFGSDAADPQPTVDFNDVRVNLGSFLSDLVAPLVETSEIVFAPITPIVDFLKAPLPVISDLAEAIGVGEVSIADIADLLAPALGPGYSELAELALTLVDVIDFLDNFQCSDPDCQNVQIDFGSFDLDGNGDLRTAALAATDITGLSPDQILATANFSQLLPSGVAPGFDIEAKINDAFADIPGGDAIATEVNNTLKKFNNGISYAFPFLDDPAAAVFKILLGRDADLFTFDASFFADPSYSEPFGTPIGIDITLTGSFTPDMSFQFGYDTFGLRKFIANGFSDFGDFLDGIFMRSATHFYIDAAVSVGAGVDVVVASAEIQGGLTFNLHADTPADVLNVDGDASKIRFRSELKDCLFDTVGSLEAFLKIVLEAGVGPLSVEDEFVLASFPLFSFKSDCSPNPFTAPDPLNLATLLPGGILRLNVGANKGDRAVEAAEDDEAYTVILKPKGQTIGVSAFGYTQKFNVADITKIQADFGDGEDTLLVQSADDLIPFSLPVVLHGGVGIDSFTYAGTGQAQMFGDDDNDVLIGGDGLNYLNGGPGDDSLTGGDGDNHLGGFTMDNVLYFEPGDDVIHGGNGPNTILAGGGNDSLYAGLSISDILFGDEGDDLLVGNSGSAQFIGSRGDDTILWKEGDGLPILIDGGADAENNTLQLAGGDFDDIFTFSKNSADSRLKVHVVNAVGTYDYLASHIQQIYCEGLQGADTTTVQPLTGTVVHDVGINLGDVIKTQQGVGDAAEDTIIVNGRSVADGVTVEAEEVLVDFENERLGGIMKITGMPNYTVRYANLEDNGSFHGLGGNDAVTILSNTGPTLLTGDANSDVFQVHAKLIGNLLQPGDPTDPKDYLAPVTIDAGAASNTLIINESQSEIADKIVMTKMKVTSDLLPGLTFTASGGNFNGGVTLTAGPFDDVVKLLSTLGGSVKTTVNGGDGNDSILVGSSPIGPIGNLNGIAGALQVDVGPGASNQLRLTDFSDANGNPNVSINANKVLGLAGPNDNVTITYLSTFGELKLILDGSNAIAPDKIRLVSPDATVAINANAGNDRVDVFSLTKQATIDGGPGNEIVNVANLTGNLADVKAPVFFFGQAGTDLVNIDDHNAPAPGQTYGILAAAVARAGASFVAFDATLETANLATSQFNDSILVGATPVVGTAVNVAAGPGSNKMTGPNTANTWEIGPTNAGRLNAKVKFASVQGLNGGTSSDLFLMPASGQGIAGAINGGFGTDELNYASYAGPVTFNLQTGAAPNIGAFAAIESFVGGNGSDSIIGLNNTGAWQVTGANQGTIGYPVGNFSFKSVENLTGGTGADTYGFNGVVGVSGKIAELGGSDTISYATAAVGVTVNLAAGTAPGVPGGFVSIESATGGSADDILIGNNQQNVLIGNDGADILVGYGGVDLLQGNGGRDLLIGGQGQDGLLGGDDDDILIGGTTSYDANPTNLPALIAIRAEWTSANTYDQRTINLRGGTGANAPFRLSTSEVQDDALMDLLIGGAGDDWFFALLDGSPQADSTDIAQPPERNQ